MVRIDALLSARLFLAPHQVGERIYFISNLSGHLSLYAMDANGSVPEPLLPPNIAFKVDALLSAAAQIKNLEQLSTQISGATAQWQGVQETSIKTAGTARFHVEVSSDGQKQPLTADETTEVLEK